MPHINLSGIKFRPYAEGEEPTDFGFDLYAPPGSRAIDLSRIKFRPWEDPILESLGGSGEEPGGGGDPDPGGGGEPGDPGAFSGLVSTTATDQYVLKNISSTTAIYVYAELYVPAADHAIMAAETGLRFYGDIIDIGAGGDPTNIWQSINLTNRNGSNVYDGNLYLWDFWSNASDRVLVAPDTWYTVEIALVLTSGTDYDAYFAVNGTVVGPYSTGSTGESGWDVITAGANFSNNVTAQSWYVDNIAYATDDFISQGGTAIFSDGFESGDTSAWDATVGGFTVGAAP